MQERTPSGVTSPSSAVEGSQCGLCRLQTTSDSKVTPKWARANGEVERFVRTVKKVSKTAKLEQKNYKQEQNKLLRNYHAAPHSTTRVAPATALFGRPMKTKLPEVTIPCSDPVIPVIPVMKKDADNKRYVKPSTTAEGATILVKRDDNKKKSAASYDPRPCTVVEKNGSMVTAVDGNGVPVTRNSSFSVQKRTNSKGSSRFYPDARGLRLCCSTVAVGCRTPETIPAAYANTPSRVR